MIVPDLNLLLYAYNDRAPQHKGAREWWEACLSGARVVGLPWVVLLGFVRLTTAGRLLVKPLTSREALEIVRSWLAQPHVRILDPGPGHLDLLESLAQDFPTLGALATDAHLAALAIEYQAELHSNDADFTRFSGLRWRNPLKPR